jgi:hypothetical protein
MSNIVPPSLERGLSTNHILSTMSNPVKVFNKLPFYIKAESDNPKKFKALLQKYLHENSFYSLDENFELQS